jgi:hypothetical protein
VILSNDARQSALIRNTNLTYDLGQLDLCVYSCQTERRSLISSIGIF